MTFASFRRSLPSFLLVLVFAAGALAQTATVSVIVELSQDPAAVAATAGSPMSEEEIETYRASLRAAQDQFLDSLRAKSIAFELGGIDVPDSTGQTVRVDFRYTLVFNGINLKVPSDAISAIESMPEVKKVHPDEDYDMHLDNSVKYIRAPEVYGAVAELTRFDDFREGFEGQGIHVSIIDTGIDWPHEMFGGDPTPPRLGVEPATALVGRNEKVIYYLPLNDIFVEDGFGHGTHVGSTAAGYLGFAPGRDGLPLTSDDVRVHGVAPQAKLLSYKVCSDVISTVSQIRPSGGCPTSNTIMALEDSMSPRTVNGFSKPVAHVINLSLGGAGTPDSASALACDNAVRLGAVVVASAGNSGPGEGTVGAPSVGRRVISVGANNDPGGGDAWSADVLDPSSINRDTTGVVTPASSFPTADGQRTNMRLFPMAGTPAPPQGSLAQYYVWVNGGEVLANWPVSASGRIAITQSSLPATFAQIANNGFVAGAVAVIFRSATTNPTAIKALIPAANMPAADFDYLKGLISATPANGDLSNHPIRMNPFFGTTFVGAMANFSSRGPVAGFGQVKPDLTAPGSTILAAVPPASLLGVLSQSNYGSVSGTSMSAPHVSGVAALVKQAHPGWTPDMIRTVLINTSTNLRDKEGVPKADPSAERVLDQGGGLVDVYEAVNAKALMGVTSTDPKLPSILGSHSFGEVPAVNSLGIVSRSVQVQVRDLSGTSGTYALGVANNRSIDLAGVSVTVSPTSVDVPAGGTGTFSVTIAIDGNVVTTGAPLQLQWYVTAARTDGAESLRMPFYLRATQAVLASATQNPIADDAFPDQQDGVDHDGRYILSWTFPADSPATPCGYRIEEANLANAGSDLFVDNAEEPLVAGANSRWSGAATWASVPHPNTTSLGYAPAYIDNQNVSLTTRTALALPASALVALSFDSFEDLELDFDFAFVEVSTDGGTTFSEAGKFTGAFSGTRSIDLSMFAGTSIRLRFRLRSDGSVSTPENRGWFIDNVKIRVGTSFASIATVDGAITSFEVSDRTDGTYGYRIVALFGDCQASPLSAAPSNVQQITVKRVVTHAPTASFTADPNPSLVGQTVQFDASASADNDSEGPAPAIVSYSWSFGDGATATSSSPTTSHSYSAAGTYRVALTVTDNDGESATTEALQTVSEPDAAVSGGGHILVAGGRANFSVDISMSDGVITKAKVSYHDHPANLKVQSTNVTRVDRIGNRATIYGDCTINKTQTGTFKMEVVDNGAGSTDQLSIEVGTYSASGTLSGGNIRVSQ